MRVRLLQINETELASQTPIQPVLESAGFIVESVVSAIDIIDDTLPFDFLLVDCRITSPDQIPSLSNNKQAFPTILLLGEQEASSDTNIRRYADEFVCESELTGWQFGLRLQQVLNRYKQPLNQLCIHSPEAKLLQTVVNHASDWVFIKDLDHRFLAVSEDYVQGLDLEFNQVIGKDDMEIGLEPELILGSEDSDFEGFWPQDDETVALGVPTVETNPEWRIFTGDTRHRRTVRAPLKNVWGDVYALLICSEDVTQIVKTEEALRERNDMLDSMTKAKTKAENSRIMAEHAVTAKNKFIAAASHDLRQPLHALGLYIDVLESKVDGELEQSLIEKIKNSSKSLSVLFNSLLDLSRLDAGVVEVNETDFVLGSMLNSLFEEMQGFAAEKDIELIVMPCATVVTGDAVLIERVIRNLLHNAISYTETGKVTVLCRPQKDVIGIDIIDTGPGIPEYERSAIFSEYYQVEDKTQRPIMGLGLGLAIVRRLVNLMGINFKLQSTVGVGSTFSLELPIGDLRNLIEEVQLNVAPTLAGIHVLVIDDEEDILDGMHHLLVSLKCDAVVATTVEQAIAKLVELNLVPDMIVADYRLLYGQTGDQAIKLIREEFNTDIPAIIVTGDTSADRLKEATHSGFKLLHKPVNSHEMLMAMSELL